MKLIITFAILVILNISANAAGFKLGDTIEYAKIYGNLSVSCYENGISDNVIHRCQAYDIEPASYSYFIGTPGINADKVVLTAHWENGKVKTKKHSYSTENGRTKKPVNLLVTTLLQRPLLSTGQNMVVYKMLHNNEEVSSGEFEINVVRGETRPCHHGHHFSNSMSDCKSSGNACNRYFDRENNCRY